MLADNIKYYRKKDGKSQKALADLCHVSTNTVAAWEKGSMPSRTHIEDLLSIFGIPEYELFCRMDVSDSLSTAIDRLYKLPEHVQFEVIGLIAKLWAEHVKKP